MPFQRFSRTVFAARPLALAGLVALFCAVPAAPAMAQQYKSIFPAGWDNTVRSRLFMRIGYVSVSTKTKSDEARDITGYVTSRDDLNKAIDTATAISAGCPSGSNQVVQTSSDADCARYSDDLGGLFWDGTVRQVLSDGFDADGVNGIGTPTGIKARAQKSAGTPVVSVGYWLDDDRTWLLEGFVLAQPLTIKLYGDGVRSDGTPNSVNGKHIATTKLLPPLVIGSYNFGSRDAIVRPYVGLGVMYAVFFDAKSTSYFDTYQGGKTTISTRNTFGAGPFVGLQSPINDDWHVNVSIGKVGLRTTSRLVTSNTIIKSGADVLNDLSPNLAFAVKNGDSLSTDQIVSGVPVTTLLTELVARNKGQANLGTFVREQKMRINNTLVNVSVGRSF